MAWKFFLSLAAAAFAAILFGLFIRRGDRARSMEESAKRRRVCADDGTAGGASSTHTSTKGQEVATSSEYGYEVFLSFRGPDTREGFTDHLYTRLDDAGIRTFKDDEELRIGKKFGPEILQAIKQSKISIPIFSKGYASSEWCLKELVQMLKCQKNGRQKIMPIFYNVAPSEVRHQTGGYAEAFLSHEKKQRYDKDTICEWKFALKEVSFLHGWNLDNMPKRREGEFVRRVTQKIFNELKKAYLEVSKCLVGVDDHVDAIMEMISAGTSETRIIGIHGMGGIGKTTLAKIIYNKLSDEFENCSSLCDIREVSKGNGIQYLQNQLISNILRRNCMDIKDYDEGTQIIKERLSNKRVLLLLDDVEEENHIDAFIGKRDWLGRGSIIIVTTRNKHILDVPEVDHSYELSSMDPNRSLQLFSKHAFRKDFPLDGYIHQSKRAIGIVGGLPLALEVIGSLLCHTKKEKWDLTLKKLENVPHAVVRSKLKISYDALDVRQQDIFLDIACLFIGYDKDILVHFWDESKFPEEAMEVLQNMSLINIKEDNKVWMHDQLRDLGREIIREKSEMKIEKQSRVWKPKEGWDLLRKHKGDKEVEALRLNDYWLQYHFTYEDLKNLSNLRFLEVRGHCCAKERLLWPESPSNVLPTNENLDLLPKLRWLSWQLIPPTFNITNFSMEDVAFLDLSHSCITQDWKGWSHMEVMKNLKVLNLTCCDCLERTPIFSAQENLERLILRNCGKLVEIDSSICHLKHLVCLELSYCRSLKRLPDRLGGDLASLEYLSLGGCESLERLPDTIENLESLIKLDISNTNIKELPNSIGKLTNLKEVKMWGSYISKIPDAFWMIKNLEEIEASRNGHIKDFDVNIGKCISGNQSLRILKLERTNVYTPPRLPESLLTLKLSWLRMDKFPDLSNLTNLKELKLEFDKPNDGVKSDGLVEYPIPQWIGNLSKLESLCMSSYYVTTSPADLSFPPRLKSLDLNCPNLRCLLRLPSSLSTFTLENCNKLCSMGDLSNLKKLSSLKIRRTTIAEIQGLGCLENLQDLRFYQLKQVKILPDLSNLNKLRSLHVGDCFNLTEIQGELPRFLHRLQIDLCFSLQKLPDLSSLMDETKVHIYECHKLNVEAILGYARRHPQYLKLVGFEQLHILPDLSNLNKLESLEVERCGNLIEIQGELPQSLARMKIYSCESLQKLPDLSSLKQLTSLDIKGCMKLKYEAILGSTRGSQATLCKNLQCLRICGLGQVEILLDLSDVNKLTILELQNCSGLVEIQGELPQSLIKLKIYSCESLQKLPDLSSLKELERVVIRGCMKLKGDIIVRSTWGSQINWWKNLIDLQICDLGQMEILPDLINSNKLRSLQLQNCSDLIEIQGELPESLVRLEISSCESLQKLPDLFSLKQLAYLYIKGCMKLKCEAILGSTQGSQAKWKNLYYLLICGLGLLEILPDLSNSTNLASLTIEHCGNLVEIQGELPQSLIKIKISSCESLQKLADLSRLERLEDVEIKGCTKLKCEAILGSARGSQTNLWKSVKYLKICGLGQVQIPPDLSNSKELTSLHLRNCGDLVEIQGELPESLVELKISSCESLWKLPDPSSMKQLKEVDIEGCTKLKVEAILGSTWRSQANLWKNLQYLRICGLGLVEILYDLSNLNTLRRLQVEHCDNLTEIQGELPQSLTKLKISSCESLQKLPDLSILKKLFQVDIEGCTKLKVEAILGSTWRSQENLWKNLLYLQICGLGLVEILYDLSNLNTLRCLQVEHCDNLTEIQGELPQSLTKLKISSCESLQKLPDLSILKKLFQVNIEGCTKLKGEVILGSAQRSHANLWEDLLYLRICSLGLVEILSDLSNLNTLRRLQVEHCDNLIEIQGELPQSLMDLKISSCESLQKLPDLSSLKRLQKIVIEGCVKLNVEAISSLCLENSVKFMREMTNLDEEWMWMCR